jgi:DNA-binding MarR family transcriptional regulator
VSEKKSLPDQVFDSLVRLFWAARRASATLQKEFGVTAPQLSALRILERRGDLSQSELSKLLLVSGSTLSGLLDRLQSRGLIKRVRNRRDRRQVRVHLTEAGREVLTTIPRGRSKFGALRQLVRELPEDEARQFLATLDTMTELFTGEPAPAPQQEPGR